MGGMSTAAILVSVNAGAQSAEVGKADPWSAALFLNALILCVKTQSYIFIAATAESGAIVHRIRVRILDEVRQVELSTIEAIGRSEIVRAVTEDAATLTQASNVLAFGLQNVALVVFVAIYVAYLSPIAFLLSVIIISVASVLYYAKTTERAKDLREASRWETQLVTRMSDLLEGFKEVRMNSARSNDLIDTIDEESRRAANIKIFARSENFKQWVFWNGALYLLLGAITFVIPIFGSVDPASTTKNTMAVVFIMGTCFGLMQTMSTLATADVATEHIARLEEKLRAAIRCLGGQIRHNVTSLRFAGAFVMGAMPKSAFAAVHGPHRRRGPGPIVSGATARKDR